MALAWRAAVDRLCALEPATSIAADTGLCGAAARLPTGRRLGGPADLRVSQPPSLPPAASNAAILKLGKLMPVGHCGDPIE